MSIRLLRWMSRAWIVVNGLVIAFTLAGAVIEIFAGIGLTARNTTLWAVLHPHPGLVVWLAVLALLTSVDILSWLARRAIERHESPPLAADQNGSSA
jgi:hypothetical protein